MRQTALTGPVVIYGGSGGIGEVVARRLTELGTLVHLVARGEARLQSLASDLGATYTVGDVTDASLFGRVASDAGETIGGLVYAVGTITLKPLARLTDADFLADYRINALGAALAVQAALPALTRGGPGAGVVLYSSVAAAQGFSFHASIGSAKGAVEALTRSLAAELAPKVRVNAVAPSLTRTPLAHRLLATEQGAAAIAALHPLPRLGTPEDIAAMTTFLLSGDASWITGQVLRVDGGRSTLRAKG